MTEQHEMTWERDTTEYVNEDNWVIREPSGATTVLCSCGFTRDVADSNVQRAIEDHLASVQTRDTA